MACFCTPPLMTPQQQHLCTVNYRCGMCPDKRNQARVPSSIATALHSFCNTPCSCHCAGHTQLQISYGQYCRPVSRIRRSCDSSHDAPSALPFYHSQNTYRTHSTLQFSSNDNRGSTRAGNHLISTSCFPFRTACTHNAPEQAHAHRV